MASSVFRKRVSPLCNQQDTAKGLINADQQGLISDVADDDSEGVAAENGRRQVKHWIDNARRLAANVAKGEFPGTY